MDFANARSVAMNRASITPCRRSRTRKCRWRCPCGRQCAEVALILAMLVVNKHNHSPGTQFVEDFFDGRKTAATLRHCGVVRCCYVHGYLRVPHHFGNEDGLVDPAVKGSRKSCHHGGSSVMSESIRSRPIGSTRNPRGRLRRVGLVMLSSDATPPRALP